MFDDTKYRRDRSQANPEVHERRKAASLAWKSRHVKKMNDIVAAAKDRPCVDCRKQLHPCCMEFDHVRGDKMFNVGKAARSGCTMDQLLAEIEKCEVRCVVCHRMRHWSE